MLGARKGVAERGEAGGGEGQAGKAIYQRIEDSLRRCTSSERCTKKASRGYLPGGRF